MNLTVPLQVYAMLLAPFFQPPFNSTEGFAEYRKSVECKGCPLEILQELKGQARGSNSIPSAKKAALLLLQPVLPEADKFLSEEQRNGTAVTTKTLSCGRPQTWQPAVLQLWYSVFVVFFNNDHDQHLAFLGGLYEYFVNPSRLLIGTEPRLSLD